MPALCLLWLSREEVPSVGGVSGTDAKRYLMVKSQALLHAAVAQKQLCGSNGNSSLAAAFDITQAVSSARSAEKGLCTSRLLSPGVNELAGAVDKPPPEPGRACEQWAEQGGNA